MVDAAIRRLDAWFGTNGAFEHLMEHTRRAATDLNGLRLTGVFYVLDESRILTQPFRTGIDEPHLEAFLRLFCRDAQYRGHGTILGANIDGKNAVVLQFVTSPTSHLTIRCDVDAHVEPRLDASAFEWPDVASTGTSPVSPTTADTPSR